MMAMDGSLRRLATFWLICAAIGFAVAVGMAVIFALTVDGAQEGHSAPMAASAVSR